MLTYNHYYLYDYLNNPNVWTSDESELYYKLELNKYPNTGIYRKRWIHFNNYINKKLLSKF